MSEHIAGRNAVLERRLKMPPKLTRKQRLARTTLVLDEPAEVQPPYLAAGTHVLTEEGEKPAESLTPQDQIILTEGETVPLLTLRAHAVAGTADIVRIRAGALAPGLPERDLRLSADQGLYFDGGLVRAGDLTDGMAIHFEPAGPTMFYEVVLPQHGVLLAEGTPLESYIDPSARAHPRPHRRAAFLSGPPLTAIRGRLHARKLMVGYTVISLPELTIEMESAALKITAQNGLAQFNIPAGITQAVLTSATFIPSETDPASSDHRRLGIGLTDLMIDERFMPLESVMAPADLYRRSPTDEITWTRGPVRLTFPPGAETLTLRIAALPQAWRAPGI